MGPGMFNGFSEAIGCGLALLAVFVPLGIWKLIELVCWVWAHMHWSLS